METRNALVRGYTGKVVNYKNAVIREFITTYAYGRNGNAHNPTPQRIWNVFVAGKLVDTCRLLRIAKTAVDALETK